MKIFIYVPGMPFDGETIASGKSLGGSETMGFYMAQLAEKAGHSVFCFCNVPDGQISITEGVHYIPIGQPSEQYPFGDRFHQLASDIPHDVLLAQRAPGIFNIDYNSKLNYFWTHDLALKRYIQPINAMMWNTTRVLGVSDWHRKQIMSIYQVEEEFSGVLPNGIDLGLFDIPVDPKAKKESKTIIYTSRPERGMVNLVKEGGIMEKLYEHDPEIRLIVAGYDNQAPQMAELYNYCYSRCAALPNVDNVGFLSKADLARTMKGAWLHVYPTEFEETSCITAMEEQAAGTPFVATSMGALPETLESGGAIWTDLDKFTETIINLDENPKIWDHHHSLALKKKDKYSLENSYKAFEKIVEEDFEKLTKDKKSLYFHFLYTSDFVAAKELAEAEGFETPEIDRTIHTSKDSVENTVDYYEDVAGMHEDRGNTHELGNHNVTYSMPRMQPVIERLKGLKKGSKVLDYGCCVGQSTTAFAAMFPDLVFYGSDISNKQVDVGLEYVEKNKIKNVHLKKDIYSPEQWGMEFDVVLCLEVLEHIWDHKPFLAGVESLAKEDGMIVMSTPIGPIEEDGGHSDGLYEHVHNFEEQDIVDMVGKKNSFFLNFTKYTGIKHFEKMGNFCWGWKRAKEKDGIGNIDYPNKFRIQNPRQTVSCCMIVKGSSDSLAKTIKSISGIIHELIIGVDGTTDDLVMARMIAKRAFNAPYNVEENIQIFQIDSPTQIGFDEARNLTIDKATKDWILWIDDDELWSWPGHMVKYLKNHQFDSFATPQMHYSIDPAGVIKTDFPSRIFRNNKGIKFFGVVHEHPETAINKGAGLAHMINPKESAIVHNGYDTEETRRRRFQRNYPLMERDVAKHWDRHLTRFLWIRDLAHKNRFELEWTKMQVTDEMIRRAKLALECWRGLVELGIPRLIIESLQYVSESAQLLTNNQAYDFRLLADFSRLGMGDNLNSQPQLIQGALETKEDVKTLIDFVTNSKLDSFSDQEKYL